jgi:hypothetical protein
LLLPSLLLLLLLLLVEGVEATRMEGMLLGVSMLAALLMLLLPALAAVLLLAAAAAAAAVVSGVRGSVGVTAVAAADAIGT